MATSDQASDSSRRNFLAQAIGACIAFLAALIGIPVVGAAVGPALRKTDLEWTSLGTAERFPDGVPTSTEFTMSIRDGWVETTETRVVWVIRSGAASFTVFSGRCTHLGCAFRWEADKSQFGCPCHGGVFGLDGHVVSGPPPRSLDTLSTRIASGVLQIQYTDFRLGVGEKAPA